MQSISHLLVGSIDRPLILEAGDIILLKESPLHLRLPGLFAVRPSPVLDAMAVLVGPLEPIGSPDQFLERD